MRRIIPWEHVREAKKEDNSIWVSRSQVQMMDNYRRISSDLLRDRLRKGESTLILDLRTAAEFADSHISGSINIPMESLDIEKFLKEHGQGPIFLVCSSGKKAYQAADRFYEAGCTDVIIMAGGLLSWRALGFPLTHNQ